MKKLLTSAGLVALSISGLQAAQELTPVEATKPWSLSAALRGFYDDNYTTSPSSLRKDSFGVEIIPSISLNLPLDQTFVGASYEFSMKYFERDEHTDKSHKFDGRLDHEFSPRYKLELDNSFAIYQEPDITTGGTPLRTEGDNIRNEGKISFTAEVTELLAVQLGYVNTFYDYEQDGEGADAGGNVIPSRSGLLDRMEHLASVDLRWEVMPETIGILGYAYKMADFSGDEQITGLANGTPPILMSDDRNSRTHRVYVGADHRFNAQLSGSVRVGGEHTDYDEGDSTLNPYADANLTYQYNREDYVQGGIRHTRTKTDVTAQDQETTALYASINHHITPNLVGSLLVQGQNSTFEGGSNDKDNEGILYSGLNLTYHINPFLFAEAGYNFDRLASDVSGRSYTRNRVYIGVRGTY
jgi:hypothetical protein